MARLIRIAIDQRSLLIFAYLQIEEEPMTRVAVLGLGAMGAGMAGCLHKAGFDLTVWNRTSERSEPFAQDARIATSPHDAAKGAEVIIGMLADDNVARSVWYGDN